VCSQAGLSFGILWRLVEALRAQRRAHVEAGWQLSSNGASPGGGGAPSTPRRRQRSSLLAAQQQGSATKVGGCLRGGAGVEGL
jgi:hypothetical protein